MRYKLYDIHKKEYVTCDFFVSADFSRILILVELDIEENDAYLRTIHRSELATEKDMYGDKYILQKENE